MQRQALLTKHIFFYLMAAKVLVLIHRKRLKVREFKNPVTVILALLSFLNALL